MSSLPPSAPNGTGAGRRAVEARLSLVAACRAVGDGEADAVVSAGNTGAMLAAGPAAPPAPPGRPAPRDRGRRSRTRRPSVLLDSGANADARPEHLLQFAHMGVVFAEEILDLREPVVRLLSIGEEPEKGNQLTLDAHALLAASELDFAGNAESRHLLAGAADVVVTDGFTGNVALKLLEGTIRSCSRRCARRSPRRRAGKLGGLLIRPAARAAPRPPRPRHLRRRLPARPARARGDRARELVAARDRERDPPRRRAASTTASSSGWRERLSNRVASARS